MRFRTLSYYMGEAVRNIIRNRLMSIASILTVASCIFIVSVFYCLAVNVNSLLNELEASLQITVFLRDDLSTDEVQRLHDRIVSIPYVTSARYVSPQTAWEEFIENMPNPELFAEVENPFRRSFDVEFDNLVHHDEVVHALSELQPYGIEDVRHSGNLAETVRSIASVVRIISFSLILLMGAISIVIITNTIRITVNARKAEINIMKYVGATDWFIRWPFAIEGILIGVIGGIIPAVVCWMSYNRVIDSINEGIPIIGFIQFLDGKEVFSYLFPFAVMLGMLIGVIGSSLSIRKHLNV